MRQPVAFTLDRDKMLASISIPALLTGVNFYIPTQHPFYRFTAVLGQVTDIAFRESKHQPVNENKYNNHTLQTEWYPTRASSAAQTLELQLPILQASKLEEGNNMILVLVIEFGFPSEGNNIALVKHVGSGVVLALG